MAADATTGTMMTAAEEVTDIEIAVEEAEVDHTRAGARIDAIEGTRLRIKHHQPQSLIH